MIENICIHFVFFMTQILLFCQNLVVGHKNIVKKVCFKLKKVGKHWLTQ